MSRMRRVAVTGIGVISPLGNSAAEVYESAYKGRSGIQLLNVPFHHRLTAPLAACVRFNGADYFDPPKLQAKPDQARRASTGAWLWIQVRHLLRGYFQRGPHLAVGKGSPPLSPTVAPSAPQVQPQPLMGSAVARAPSRYRTQSSMNTSSNHWTKVAGACFERATAWRR